MSFIGTLMEDTMNTTMSASTTIDDGSTISIQSIRVDMDSSNIEYTLEGQPQDLGASSRPISRNIPVAAGTQFTIVVRRSDNTEDEYTEADYTITIEQAAGSEIRIRVKVFLEGPLQ